MRKAALALAALAFSATAAAQSGFPSKSITTVVGFEPGGGTDTVARIVAKTLGDQVHQQVVVENRAGAGGDIAVQYVSKAAPDGYTLVLANVGSLAVNPHLLHTGYDPLKDLTPITMAVVFANVLVVQPSLPVKSLADFVNLAKKEPGKLTYASSGIGGAGHLAGELLKMVAHVDIVHVPYKGGGPAAQGFLGKQVDSFFATPVSSIKQIQAGRANAIATTGSKRSKLLPNVPTVAEQGYPGYEALNWYAYLAPASLPKDITAKLNAELVKALKSPEVLSAFDKQGVEAQPGTPEELAAYMKREYDTWGNVVKKAGIKAQ